MEEGGSGTVTVYIHHLCPLHWTMRSHMVTTGADEYWFLWIPQCELFIPGADARKPLPQAVPRSEDSGIDAWV